MLLTLQYLLMIIQLALINKGLGNLNLATRLRYVYGWSTLHACRQPTKFTNNSNYIVNPIANTQWAFSDGGTTSLIDPIYPFNVNKSIGDTAWAILYITDNIGCKDTFDSRETGNYIEVHPLPVIQFISDPICEGENFVFINTSYMASPLFNDTLIYPSPVWSFQNGAVTSNSPNIWNNFIPNDLLYPAGIYNLELNMGTSFQSEYDTNYCIDDYNGNVEIKVMPKISYTETFNPPNKCGNNVNYNFIATHQYVNSWQYEIIDQYQGYTMIDTINIDLNYTFLKPFNYPFSIIINNLNGCSDTIKNSLHIFPNPIALFNPNDTAQCENLEVPFRNLSYILDTNTLYFNSLNADDTTFIKSYYWDFDNNNSYVTGDFDNPTENYLAQNGGTSTYYPSLTVTTNESCVHTFFGNSITAYPTPIANIIHPDIYGPFSPGQYIFNGTNSTTSDGSPASTSVFEYNWITGYNLIDNSYNLDSITYQYQSNSNFQGNSEPILYDVCLILIDENSQFRCRDTFCIEPGLFVDYFKGLYVPNALAPNGNSGEASYFLPKGKSLKDYNLKIFDTWGNLVWQTSALTNLDGKPAIGWDGTTLDNKPLQQGTYVWKIYAKFSDGSIWQGIDGKTTGPIYLIR